MGYARIGYSESVLRERVKAADAIWRHKHKLWELDWNTAREFGLQERLVEETLD